MQSMNDGSLVPGALACILVLQSILAGLALADEWHWDLGIVVDPGHGGPGACQWTPPCECYGAYGPNGLTEDWVNHEIAPVAAAYWDLITWDGVVEPTRQDVSQDYPRFPEHRVNVANGADGVDVFVSIHHNSYSPSIAQKSQAYYADTSVPNPETGEWRYMLADAVLDRVRMAFGFAGELEPRPDSDSQYQSLYVLQHTNMPAALIEASNIKDPDEEYLLAYDESHRAAEGRAIGDGIMDYGGVTAPDGLGCEDYYSQDQYRVFWNPVPGADGYLLYWDDTGQPEWGSWGFEGYVECQDTTCVLTEEQLWPLGYFFAVRAYVSAPSGGSERFLSSFSEWLSRSEQCDPVSTNRNIWGFTAAGGDHRVTLTWKAASFDDGKGFHIYRSTNGGQCYDCNPPIGYVPFDYYQEDYSFVDTTTAYDMTYFYKILDTEGWDWWGPASAAPTTGVEAPPSPSPAPTLAVDHVGSDHVRLCVEQGSEYASQYRVYWKVEGGSWADTLHQGEPCLDVPGLETGTVYVFCARGENSSGVTDLSSEVRAMPIPAPPYLHGEVGYRCIRLWWGEVALASGYRVFYSWYPYDPWAEVVDVGDTTATTLADLEGAVQHYVWVVGYDQFGNNSESSNMFVGTPQSVASVEASDSGAPRAFALGTNYPNPFNPSTQIPYDLSVACGQVRLVVYDVRGRQLRTLVDEGHRAGSYAVTWDGRDSEGRLMPSGVYFCRLETATFSQTRKMVLLK